MGNCTSLTSRNRVVTLTSGSTVSYSRRTILKIKLRNSNGKVISNQSTEFPVTEPRYSNSKILSLKDKTYTISSIL